MFVSHFYKDLMIQVIQCPCCPPVCWKNFSKSTISARRVCDGTLSTWTLLDIVLKALCISEWPKVHMSIFLDTVINSVLLVFFNKLFIYQSLLLSKSAYCIFHFFYYFSELSAKWGLSVTCFNWWWSLFTSLCILANCCWTLAFSIFPADNLFKIFPLHYAQ